MSINRFYEIMSNLSFDNVLERHQRRSSEPFSSRAPRANRLKPIEDVFQQVVGNFRRIYVPAKQLSCDEHFVKFRGHCPFRVYMPRKPGKYGIRIWAINDVLSGYILNLKIYEGRSEAGPEVGLAKQVVLQLAEPYRGSERCITADNYFTSIDLVRALLEMRLTYCGTLRKTRREVPTIARNLNMTREENLFLFNEESKITLLRHKMARSKFVLMLSSTYYDSSMVTVTSRSRSRQLPSLIDFYNCNKVGIDIADQMISYYTAQYPSRRWPMKIFAHLVDSVALNSFVIWTRNDPLWQASTKSKRRLFLRELACELVIPQVHHRAATIPNLHEEISEAMGILGVEYHLQDRPLAIPVALSGHGRCPFCGPRSSQRRTTTRKCATCDVFVCGPCSTVLCPTCTPQP